MRRSAMISITCDNCGAERPERLPSSEEWILGYDIELESPNAVQRSLRFLDHWDDRRVMEFGAIHLCSEQCKVEYKTAEAA
ncbi:hypothetical protein Acid345_3197 [Candidatus Koribacter versatilis Ellin345]|uniref:Uncharacterized protein n=2 Tax=Candidatus Korobacter versatilis TaxID=658062 RepID=Q1ILQ2_KORVE|nr:hypothetical protein Acid345_3197 [Candidatus Koribacter versatilis Ellin345]